MKGTVYRMDKISGQNRISEYSNLKAFATVLVVVGHITRIFTSGGVIQVSNNAVCQFITDVIYSFHMPLFMCVSGAIYFQCVKNGKYQSYRNMIKNKAKRLMLPYLFWGLFYVAPVVKLLNITGLSFQKYVLFGIILGADSRHLWYLFSLFMIFIFIGMIDQAISHKWNNNILNVLFVVSAITSCIHQYIPTIFSMNYSVRFFCYFVFGMLLSSNREKYLSILRKKQWIVVLSFGIFMIAFAFRNLKISVLITALSGIVVSFCFVIFIEKRWNDNFIVRLLKDYSMGIYIIHPMIIYGWFYLVQDKMNTFLSCCCVFTISIGVSILGVFLLRKAKLQYLIGE